MQRLKRVFAIDIETCPERRLSRYGDLRAGVPISACGGAVKIIASIEDPTVINQILAHLDQRVASSKVARLP